MRNGYLLPKTNFTQAIKFRNKLKLRESQMDSLVSGCIYVIKAKKEFQIKYPDRFYQLKGYEKSMLPKILDSWQYESLIYENY